MTIDDLISQARKKGSDKKFRDWVSRQPSCISGRFSEWVNGQGRCIAAHVRRAGESGTAFKAEYACVPLTNDEHLEQHQHGEEAPLDLIGIFTREEAKDWFDRQRARYLLRWLSL